MSKIIIGAFIGILSYLGIETKDVKFIFIDNFIIIFPIILIFFIIGYWIGSIFSHNKDEDNVKSIIRKKDIAIKELQKDKLFLQNILKEKNINEK